MNAKQRERLDSFIAGGAAPKTSASGAVIARVGTRFQQLVDATGDRTAAGRYYEAQTGQELAVGGFDTSQAPQRTGNTEFIAMRDGTQKATSRWDPTTQAYKFTALGKSFYSRLTRN